MMRTLRLAGLVAFSAIGQHAIAQDALWFSPAAPARPGETQTNTAAATSRSVPEPMPSTILQDDGGLQHSVAGWQQIYAWNPSMQPSPSLWFDLDTIQTSAEPLLSAEQATVHWPQRQRDPNWSFNLSTQEANGSGSQSLAKGFQTGRAEEGSPTVVDAAADSWIAALENERQDFLIQQATAIDYSGTSPVTHEAAEGVRWSTGALQENASNFWINDWKQGLVEGFWDQPGKDGLIDVFHDLPGTANLTSRTSVQQSAHESTYAMLDGVQEADWELSASDRRANVLDFESSESSGLLSTESMIGPLRSATKLFNQLEIQETLVSRASVMPTGPRNDAMQFTWMPAAYTWISPAFYHKPLYFEQPNLERYGIGHTHATQPLLSSVHFFGSIPLVPYKTLTHHPRERVYTLGHGRPGNCVPVQRGVVLGQSKVGEVFMFWEEGNGY